MRTSNSREGCGFELGPAAGSSNLTKKKHKMKVFALKALRALTIEELESQLK